MDVVAASDSGVRVALVKSAGVDVVAASDSGVRVALIRVRWCGCGSSE